MTMTIEEAKRMVGTEFTYIFEDGDTILAYVKAFDPEIGLTCFSLETETRDGWSMDEDDKEKDGTFCVIGVDFRMHPLNDAIKYLSNIKNHGKTRAVRDGDIFMGCAF